MNLKVRVKNPVFWVQIVLSILTPVLAYAGLTAQDLTTWSKVGELIVGAISNPYVLSLVVVFRRRNLLGFSPEERRAAVVDFPTVVQHKGGKTEKNP